MRETVDIVVAAATGDALGESPCWIHATGELYWIDLRRPALHRLGSAGAVESWAMPEVIGGVVGRRSGGVVVALKNGLHGFDPASGRLTRLVTVESGPPEHRLNDTKCDVAGRIWTSSMWDFGAQTTGALYRVEAAGTLTRIRDTVAVPNAICFSPDGGTIYFADTRRGAIERATFDPVSGAVGAWSVFVADDAAPGHPDGATVDAEGFLWNARVQGGVVARFAPDGRLDRLIELPVTQPTSCSFGGPGLRTLFVTTATQKLDAAELARQPLAGSLLALDVGVAGLPEAIFAG